MTATDDVVEDEPDDHPGHVVERRCGRDGTRAAEDDREVDVLHGRVRPLARDEPPGERAGRADEEEEHETTARRRYQSEGAMIITWKVHLLVHLALRELASGTDDTPDDGCSAEDLRRRALRGR